MSNMFGAPRTPEELRSVPQGVTVGSYNSYLDAQKAVDYLADQQFPVQYVSIVGNDLKLVERVTGRLSYPRVAVSGLLSGVWFGLFVGLLLSFFSPAGGSFSVVTSVLMGAAFFALFSIVSYAMQRGKRDFTSTSQVLASNYDVIVAPEAAAEASRLLQQLPMRGSNDGGGFFHRHTHDQNGHGQNGHGQEEPPQRPDGWGDPYGHGGHRPQQPQAPEQPQESANPDYRDLPDGRPQYGVRLPHPGEQQPQQPRRQGPQPQQPSEEGQDPEHSHPEHPQEGDGRER
ncbi:MULTISPECIES: general stress protein [Arthrobacter]|uniref:General stress protein n=2 Tax=Arthrobacter TaxID=1663 RepID=A0ABU9KMS3_9MICC|nr:general stress protein [Arthrobacter sp. YJM1]MDP5227144.1 ECF transporter S component [Arthrobacter sp. YJM1]